MQKHVAPCGAANMKPSAWWSLTGDVWLHTARGEEGAVDNNSQIYFTAPVSHKIRAEKFTAERVTDREADVTFP